MAVISSKSVGDLITSSDFNALTNKTQNGTDTDVNMDFQLGRISVRVETSLPGSGRQGELVLVPGSGVFYYDGGWINMSGENRLLEFIEFWENNSVDLGLWSESGNGSVSVLNGSGWNYVELDTGTTLNDSISLAGKTLWTVNPSDFGTSNSNVKRLVFRGVVQFCNVGNVDNATFFLGFNSVLNGDRTNANIIGFYLNSDALAVVVDSGGTEQVDTTTFSTVTLTSKNLFEIWVENNSVTFKVNGVSKSFTTGLPTFDGYFDVFVKNDVAASGVVRIGNIEVYVDENN